MGMNIRGATWGILLLSSFGLAGCGVTYVSPLVREQENDGVTG